MVGQGNSPGASGSGLWSILPTSVIVPSPIWRTTAALTSLRQSLNGMTANCSGSHHRNALWSHSTGLLPPPASQESKTVGADRFETSKSVALEPVVVPSSVAS